MGTRIFGWMIVVSSVIGALCAVVIIGWPAEVSQDRYSYPFSPTSYVVSQLFFAARDVVTLVGLLGLTSVLWAQAGRWVRAGLVIADAGMVLFVAAELFALTARNAATVSPEADAVNAFYGPPMIVHGIGLIIAGVGLASSRLLPGTLGRWIVLAAGVYIFVPVFPAVFAPLVVGRIAIGTWLLVYAGIGLALVRYASADRNLELARS